MAASMKACRRYILWLAHDYLEFRLPEIRSISSLFGIQLHFPNGEPDVNNPFLIVDLPSEEDARTIVSRCITIRSLFELWGQGTTFTELEADIQRLPQARKAHFFSAKYSFRVRHEAFNKVVPQTEKTHKIKSILRDDLLSFEGKVDLKNPDLSLYLLEHYNTDGGSEPPGEPNTIYFGRWIADGQRSLIQKYHLQKRKFIGNTSMEAGLSLIMANMAKVNSADLVFDPFVGTGSLLIACAHFGGFVMGTDIDYNIIYGRGKASRKGVKWRGQEDNIQCNLRQYGLENQYVDVLRADASQHSLWKYHSMFDAIISDPPYGIREPTEKVGSRKTDSSSQESKDGRHPKTESYELSDIFKDLLNFAAKYLRLGGRLVYWLPVYKPEYVEENVPQHPCMRVVANSEQGLSAKISRRLITMEKLYQFQEEDVEAEIARDHYRGEISFRDRYFQPKDGDKSSEDRTTTVDSGSDRPVCQTKSPAKNDNGQSACQTKQAKLSEESETKLSIKQTNRLRNTESETPIEQNVKQDDNLKAESDKR